MNKIDTYWVREAKRLVKDPGVARQVVEMFAPRTDPSVTMPGEVVSHLRGLFQASEVEKLGLIAVDRRLKIISSELVSQGNDAFTIVCPKRVVRWALTLHRSPYAIVMAHNHPSGDPLPSMEDDRVTRKVEVACQAVGLVLMDHIVLGAGAAYYSYAAAGRIQKTVNTVDYTT